MEASAKIELICKKIIEDNSINLVPDKEFLPKTRKGLIKNLDQTSFLDRDQNIIITTYRNEPSFYRFEDIEQEAIDLLIERMQIVTHGISHYVCVNGLDVEIREGTRDLSSDELGRRFSFRILESLRKSIYEIVSAVYIKDERTYISRVTWDKGYHKYGLCLATKKELKTLLKNIHDYCVYDKYMFTSYEATKDSEESLKEWLRTH